jgi:integrase
MGLGNPEAFQEADPAAHRLYQGRATIAPGRKRYELSTRLVGRNPLIEKAVWLALLTGLRRGELLAARWDRIDFERRIWLVPETKTGYDRRIPFQGRSR